VVVRGARDAADKGSGWVLYFTETEVKCEYGRIQDPCKNCAERGIPCDETEKIFGPVSSRKALLKVPVVQSLETADRHEDYEDTSAGVEQIGAQTKDFHIERKCEDLRRILFSNENRACEGRIHYPDSDEVVGLVTRPLRESRGSDFVCSEMDDIRRDIDQKIRGTYVYLQDQVSSRFEKIEDKLKQGAPALAERSHLADAKIRCMVDIHSLQIFSEELNRLEDETYSVQEKMYRNGENTWDPQWQSELTRLQYNFYIMMEYLLQIAATYLRDSFSSQSELTKALEALRCDLGMLFGKTPLQYALVWGHDDLVKFLLEARADVHTVDGWGLTALHYATSRGRAVEVVKMLLEAGAHVDSRDRNERAALHFAAENGHVEVVKILLKAGADIYSRDRDGRVPLHFAAEKGHVKVVEILLKAGADINSSDHAGWTGLRLATENGHFEVVEMLLEASGDVHSRDHSGRAALQAAARDIPKSVRSGRRGALKCARCHRMKRVWLQI
jgi:ankyrin repeat protein